MSADHKQIAYKWISRTLTSDKEIKVLEEKLLRLETDINNCVKPMEKSEVQNGSSSNSQEIKLAEYSDLRNEIQTRISKLQSDDMKVLSAIRKLEDASERVILIERYVNRKKWKDIYDEVYMSKTTCFRHHEHALEEIYDYIPQADLLEMTED